MTIGLFEIILILFFTALIVSAVFRQFQLPVIFGYLVVGALVGPHALGLVPNLPIVGTLAEFGIVFLMFTVGLEFSLPKLYTLRLQVFVMGTFQVLLTILITMLVGLYFNMTTLSALVIGSIVAMSSTAIVVKQLNDQLELHTEFGLNAFGILLFQDLAVIPIIILIASLSEAPILSLGTIFLWAALKGLVAIFAIIILGRWILKPLFSLISKTRALELFTLTVLLVTLFAAWVTNTLGLSYALGAFLAGMMLGETEYRHQIEIEIRPFRDILLSLFFITIGMLADIPAWYQTAFWILLLISALIIGKLFLISIISRLFGNSLSISLRTGLVLAQGGEFGFAILTLALQKNLLPPDYGQVVLAALLISIGLSPLLIHFNKQIVEFFMPRLLKTSAEKEKHRITALTKKFKRQPILICGYGRMGQHIAHLLDKVNYPYMALDLDAELVQRVNLAGDHAMYGDPTHPDILRTAGIARAKALIISFNDLKSAIKILSITKRDYPNLPVLVRCRDEFELKQLKAYGKVEVIAELFEASLTLSHHLLHLLRISPNKITDIMHEIRSKDYDLLYKVFSSEDDHKQAIQSDAQNREELRPILITKGAFSINKQLKELNLKELNIEIIAMRRGDTKHFKPHGNIKLYPDDILILFGTVANLEKAKQRLLNG